MARMPDSFAILRAIFQLDSANDAFDSLTYTIRSGPQEIGWLRVRIKTNEGKKLLEAHLIFESIECGLACIGDRETFAWTLIAFLRQASAYDELNMVVPWADDRYIDFLDDSGLSVSPLVPGNAPRN